jgi:predicted  nucleic acid-binding Zn-ribbon protein
MAQQLNALTERVDQLEEQNKKLHHKLKTIKEGLSKIIGTIDNWCESHCKSFTTAPKRHREESC